MVLWQTVHIDEVAPPMVIPVQANSQGLDTMLATAMVTPEKHRGSQ